MTSTTSPTERVGRYQLLDPIGVGPSGAVSRAKVFGVAGFERQFAVKRFHAELTATAAMAAMLSAAARAYGSLEHPRIARMSEFGVAQGTTFTAVEYVIGLDALRLMAEARLAGVTLAAGGALALVSQAARAVGYAHGRGLTHLGLAPTNVIVTAEGDIKITDFGILSATLAPRSADAPRLAQRIPYLAPEQLANEATSAATDVFALGVLAYELVTGGRAYKGDTPQQVAAAIMAGPPPEPPLPRPIVRVLSRCLARSPFERFPDARALADALDAALRVAPVPGTRKDIGAQVKETLDRLAALNEGQMSGVVALNMGTGPIPRLDDDAARRTAPSIVREPPVRDSDRKMTLDLKRPGGGPVTVVGGPVTVGGPSLSGGPVTVGGPSLSGGPVTVGGPSPSGGPVTVGGPSPSGPATTVPDLPRYPIMTVPGVPPPPIPIPAGVGAPAAPPPGTGTLLGVGKAPPVIPSGRQMPRPGSSSGLPPSRPPVIPAIPRRAATRPGSDLSIPVEPVASSVKSDPSSDSAIHALDPGDVVSLDSGLVDIVELDALADNASGEASSAPTRTLRAASPAGSAAGVADAKGAPQEPPPGAPIARPTGPTSTSASEGVDGDADDDHSFDAENTPDGGARASHTTPANAISSETIVGFGAPQARTAVPPPHPQGSPEAADREPPRDPGEVADAGDPGMAMRFEGSLPASDASDEAPGLEATMPPARHPEDGEAHPEVSPRLPAVPPGWVATPPLPTATYDPEDRSAGQPRRRGLGIALGVIGAAILGVGAWQVYLRVVAPAATHHDGNAAGKPPGDARLAVAPLADAAQLAVAPPTDDAQAVAPPPADAAQARVATAPADAAIPPGDARSAPADAAQVATVNPGPPATGPATAPATGPATAPTTGPATGDVLAIASTPPGARVFLDGSDTGTTPLKLPGSPDRHTIALLLAGHELYVAQVDGRGAFQIPLKEVTPSNGPAGIKVLRCKDKDRYYVFVDGKPTGQTCPTERIGCDVGPHTVEVYDVVSETRRKWDIVVKDTRLSFRVRVE